VFKKDVNHLPVLFSLVSMDGILFEGPFQQTPLGGVVDRMRGIRAGPDGKIYALWLESWKPPATYLPDLTYAESRDYGRTFPIREFIYDNNDPDDPGTGEPALAIAPDETRCVVEQLSRYAQCGH
jgi:hypothetical protein